MKVSLSYGLKVFHICICFLSLVTPSLDFSSLNNFLPCRSDSCSIQWCNKCSSRDCAFCLLHVCTELRLPNNIFIDWVGVSGWYTSSFLTLIAPSSKRASSSASVWVSALNTLYSSSSAYWLTLSCCTICYCCAYSF